jgi:hypothetical protein
VIIIAARVAAIRIVVTVGFTCASLKVAHDAAAGRREVDLNLVLDRSISASGAGVIGAGSTFFPRAIADQQSIEKRSFMAAVRKLREGGCLPSKAAVCMFDVGLVRFVEAGLASWISQVYPHSSAFVRTTLVTPWSIAFRFFASPVELLKTQCVTSNRTVGNIIHDMVLNCRQNGFLTLYKGAVLNSMSGLGFLPWWSSYLAMNTLFPNDGSRTISQHLAVGVVPSVLTDFSMNPFRVLKVQAMTDRGLQLAAVGSFIKSNGIGCLFWGLSGRLLPGAFQSALFVLSMESLSNNK